METGGTTAAMVICTRVTESHTSSRASLVSYPTCSNSRGGLVVQAGKETEGTSAAVVI